MKIRQGMLLFLILSLGLGLRMYGLGNKPIWYDEACSIASALKNLNYFFGPPHTFSYSTFYFLTLKLWINAFGQSEFAARFLSVIYSVSSIYLIYRLANLLFSRKVALMSSFLLSISAFHIFHAQQVRYHSLMVTLVLAAYLFWVKFLFSPKMKYVLLTSLLNFLILNTHPYGLLIIIAQVIFVLIYSKIITKAVAFKWIVLQAIEVALYAILFLLPSRYYLSEKIWWIQKSSPFSLREFLFTLMFGAHRYGLSDYDLSPALLVMPQILSLIFFGITLSLAVNLPKKTNDAESRVAPLRSTFLFCWLLVPIAIAYAVSYFKPLFAIKHLIYLLPPFLILSAKGYNVVQGQVSKIALLAAVIMISVFSLPLVYSKNYSVDWRQPATYISHEYKPGESILICTCKEILPFMYYFDYANKDRLAALDTYGEWSKGTWKEIITRNGAVVVGINEGRPAAPWVPFEDFKKKFAINRFSWHDKNIWLAASRWGWFGNFPLIEGKLTKTHIKIFEKQFPGVSVTYWKKITSSSDR